MTVIIYCTLLFTCPSVTHAALGLEKQAWCGAIALTSLRRAPDRQCCLSYQRTLKLLFWDEQLFYRAHYVPRFRHGLHAVILFFDITNRQSFESLHQWIQAAAWEGKTRTMVLMGNKTDLDAHRKVTYQEAQAFAQSEGLVYFEGSAKQNVGVEELVHHVAFEALARLVADEPPVPPDDNLEVKTSTTSCQVL